MNEVNKGHQISRLSYINVLFHKMALLPIFLHNSQRSAYTGVELQSRSTHLDVNKVFWCLAATLEVKETTINAVPAQTGRETETLFIEGKS